MDNNAAAIRTILVLEELSKQKTINLEKLAKKTDLPKATLLRFLNTLCSEGYVYRDVNDMYSLTLKMFSVGSRSLEHMDLNRIARPIAEELSEDLGETVHMGIREENKAIYVLKVESKYTIRMYSRVGKSIQLYCTAIGKALLADLDPNERAKIMEQIKFVPFTPHTIKNPRELEEELHVISENGWSMDREEHEEGVSCICAPIKDYSGKTIAAISVSWPMFRFKKEKQQSYVGIIQTAAEKISSLMGYTKPE